MGDVRERRVEDLEACGRVLKAVHAADGYPVEGVADVRAWLMPPSLDRAWVFDQEGEILGHVALAVPTLAETAEWRRLTDDAAVPEAGLRMLCRLFVSPEARGIGAGRALMEAAMSDAQVSRQQLLLDVMLKDHAAIALYERLGWQPLGDSQHTGGVHGPTPARWFRWPERP